MAERLTDHRYRTIDPTKLILTISKMADRVEEHFPASGLSSVANEVAAVAEGMIARVKEIKKPRMGLRIMVGFMVVLVVSGPLLFSLLLSFSDSMTNLGNFLQATDAGLHMLLVLAGGIAFLIGMENRLRRNQALEGLAEFRSLAHLVDLHQINKDPGVDEVIAPEHDRRTVRSDEERAYYLDYSGDLLSIVGKLAAYYAQNLQEWVVLDAVNEIETLTSTLSNKLWLKILVLREMMTKAQTGFESWKSSPLLNALCPGIPGRENRRILIEDGKGLCRNVLLVHDDGVNMLGEPIIIESPLTFAALGISPAVFNEPLLRRPFLEVDPHQNHGMIGSSGSKTRAIGFGEIEFHAEKGFIIEKVYLH